MPSSIVSPPFRRLLLAIMLVLAAVNAMPAYALQEIQVLDCPAGTPTCEGDGVTVEILADGESTESGLQWSLSRTTLDAGTIVQPSMAGLQTQYTVSVEEGTVGLTASTPVTCTGTCRLATDVLATTPVALAEDAVLIPAGTEVLLEAGDVATFGEDGASTHTFRNPGDTEARFLATMASPDDPSRCYGRCLGYF